MEGSGRDNQQGSARTHPGHSHYTRSQVINGFKAAGVLPFSFVGNQAYALLGSESTRTGPGGKARAIMWRDFGGQREAADEDDIETAAREFSEETLGMFGGCGVDDTAVAQSHESMAALLRQTGRSMRVIHPLRVGAYHMWVAPVVYLDAVLLHLARLQAVGPAVRFGLPSPKGACNNTEIEPGAAKAAAPTGLCNSAAAAASKAAIARKKHACGEADTATMVAEPVALQSSGTEQNSSDRSPGRSLKGSEKLDYIWVLLEDLLLSVAKPAGRYYFNSRRRLAQGQKGGLGSREGLQLHPCFAASLRMAQAAGLDHLVRSCQAQPLSPALNRCSKLQPMALDLDPVLAPLVRLNASPARADQLLPLCIGELPCGSLECTAVAINPYPVMQPCTSTACCSAYAASQLPVCEGGPGKGSSSCTTPGRGLTGAGVCTDSETAAGTVLGSDECATQAETAHQQKSHCVVPLASGTRTMALATARPNSLIYWLSYTSTNGTTVAGEMGIELQPPPPLHGSRHSNGKRVA